MDEPSNEFAQQLRSLRETQGLTVRALADRVGVSKVTIWKWEKGSSKPSARMTSSLARALDITPGQLRLLDPGTRSAASPIDDAGFEAVNPGALSEVIARAKKMIADASGVRTQNVTITIEY